jgi:putative ABC transport system permease protein
MIRHLLKLIWARKRANALLILEIFISFIVVFSVAVLAVTNLRRLGSPLGFDWRDVYVVGISFADVDAEQKSDTTERTGDIVRELEGLPEVVATAAGFIVPFEQAMASTNFERDGLRVEARFTSLGDEANRVLGIDVIQGGWFSPSDDALDWEPVVINRALAQQCFGDDEPINQYLSDEKEKRVVGVVDEFRWGGELSRLGPAFVSRLSTEKPNSFRPGRFLVRTAPGTSAEIEEKLVAAVRAVAPDWRLTVEPLERVRQRSFKLGLAPFVLAVAISGSLMIMVMLGMVGVFWQAVTARLHELGLRRAMGATRAQLYGQLVLEVVLVTAVGSVLATVIVVQMPLLGLLGAINWGTILGALGTTFLLLLCLATLSGLYPAWLASRIEPGHALHDE